MQDNISWEIKDRHVIIHYPDPTGVGRVGNSVRHCILDHDSMRSLITDYFENRKEQFPEEKLKDRIRLDQTLAKFRDKAKATVAKILNDPHRLILLAQLYDAILAAD